MTGARLGGWKNKRVENQKARFLNGSGFLTKTGRLPTLPHSCLCSTIGAEKLNFRVRDGNGWVLLATVTQKLGTAEYLTGLERKQASGGKQRSFELCAVEFYG